MDLSLGAAVDWADVPLAEVLATTGTPIEDVFAAPRAAAIDLVGHAGAAKILELHAAGRCDGIISWAGAVGTTTATHVMRALPFGVPKVMLSDMAASDISRWIGNKDIYMVNPTAEQGVNVVTRRAVGERGGRRRGDGEAARGAGRLAAALRDHVVRLDDPDRRALLGVHGGARLGHGHLPRGRRPGGHDGGPHPVGPHHRRSSTSRPPS